MYSYICPQYPEQHHTIAQDMRECLITIFVQHDNGQSVRLDIIDRGFYEMNNNST